MDDEVVILDGPPTCPVCGSPRPILLGILGSLVWLRCRDCGIDYPVRDAYVAEEED